MSRFGNDRMPGGHGEADVLHGWALVDAASPALMAFYALEQQLDAIAQNLHVVVLGAPTYETFQPTDPQVPAVLATLAAAVEPGPVWLVHAWARFQPRTLPAAARAAAADLVGVSAAELDAAYTGQPS
jgi:hypothetical protein